MARIFTEDFEGGISGTTITTGNTAFSYVTGGPTFSTAAAGVGALGMRTPGYAGATLGARTTGYGRVYVRYNSLGTIAWLWNILTATPANAATLRVNANGTVRIMPGTSGTILESTTGGGQLTAGQWARLEWAITGTTMQLRMFTGANLHGTTPDYQSAATTWAGATFANSQIGDISSSGLGVDIDAFAWDGTTWVGPAVTEPDPDPPATVTTYGYDGTAWVPLGPATPASSSLQVNHIGYVGDSLTQQSSPSRVPNSLGTLGWSTEQRRVSGHIGRPINGTNQLTTTTQTTEHTISTWRGEGFRPRVWVIALGANNIFESQGSWPGRIHTICNLLAEGGPGQTVYWVNQVYQPGSQYDHLAAPFNTALANALASRADTGITWTPVDLHGLLRNGRDESNLWAGGSDDGRHMSATGYELRNTLIGSVIGAEAP